MLNDIDEFIRELAALEDALLSANPDEESIQELINKLDE